MKIQYTGTANMSTCNKVFNTSGQLEDVSEKDGNYLLKTFPDKFNKIEPTGATKVKTRAKQKEVEKDK